jgi:hypothetical protein
MHDFIQALSFTTGRSLLLPRSAVGGWVQRGIMRSFGEDEVVAPYLSSPRQPVRTNQKSRSKTRK